MGGITALKGIMMFDVSTINKRYFDIKIAKLELEVEPPKVKTLKKILKLSESKDSLSDLAEAVKMVLNKNKSGYVVSDKITDELDYDQLDGILTAFFEWLGKSKNSPN